jgi:DNA-binding MarR family transcriptional regulator
MGKKRKQARAAKRDAGRSPAIVPDTELAARLHSATLHLLRRLAREDSASGVSPARLSALSVLVFAAPMTIGRLATAEGVTAPTMTRLVAGMVEAGFVTREPDPDDRRVVRVTASDEGRRLLLAGRDRRVAAMQALLEPLGPPDRERLADATRLIERMIGERH